MKRIMIIMAAMVCTMTVSAQFTVYEPVYVPRQQAPITRSNTYNPFTVYEPIGVPTPRVQKQVKTLTLKGYYKKADKGWVCAPIKVAITDDDVKLVGLKLSNQWAGVNAAVSEVSSLDPEIVRDNFNFKAYSSLVGTIYF